MGTHVSTRTLALALLVLCTLYHLARTCTYQLKDQSAGEGEVWPLHLTNNFKLALLLPLLAEPSAFLRPMDNHPATQCCPLAQLRARSRGL
ncbi:hypothetical protein BDM02DRAFT_3120366 [Thelephora ganbajun]|uniref:Uncharacterized protein n=1 Tax=Thelephora ganbajun TaxID=370292 RepID=A0ACB6Z752_THEGA|nr:hypothetical protein BDM02DRAFT_3120366 [Thelephora ganbajun]